MVGDLGIAEGAFAQGAAGRGGCTGAECHLSTAEHLDVSGVSDALARTGNVAPQRLDLVAEELGSHWVGGVGSEDVEHPSADRERPRLGRVVETFVTHAGETICGLFKIDTRPGFKHERREDVAALGR